MNYYTEFEFESMGRRYWLPLSLRAENLEAAEDLALRWEVALRNNFTLLHSLSPRLYVEGLTSDFLNNFKERHTGRIVPLNVRLWTIETINTDPTLTLDQNLDIEFIEEVTPETIAHGIEFKLPVRIVADPPDGVTGEVLVVDVVLPTRSSEERANDVGAPKTC